ncbi:hypothetical protein EDM52_23660 [Brevibacillus invocatus]|uniref:MFS transporter n=1 Tax=Brevibacillus invocatus TaxID=173959 RepID=A0A3M8BR35_9BACL|nr:hypothetical protein [Brevibacillus invocatus]RNB65869.1 hypothetical protein EDM52_23660 [Brevibacillus invocatus]
MVIGNIIIMLGLSPLMVLNTDLVVASVPPEKTGAASSLSEMSSELGMALSISIFGIIGTAVYRHLVAGYIPNGISQETGQAVRDTLAGAVTVAKSLPYDSVLEAAKHAFLSGIQVVGGVSSILLLGLIVLYLTLLRDVRR